MISAPATTQQPRNPAARPPASRAAWRAYLPGAAGAAYLMAWVIGLAVWPVNLPLNATAAQAMASHAAHPAAAATQYLLAEGLAGLLLAAVLGSVLIPRLRARTGSRATVTATVTAAILGSIAVVTSLTQCVIGLLLISAADRGDVAVSGDLFKLVNQLDGVKMLALAVTAFCLATLGGPATALPRWLRVTALPLAVALAASGYAYLTLTNALGWTAFVSGVLLLMWVTGTGIALTIRRRTSLLAPAI
jgi:hypothetical protein